MNKQISVTMPMPMYRYTVQKAKKDGHRSVQEYMLQALRDKWFMDRLPHYERIMKDLDEGKGTKMTIEEFERWNERLRKKYAKR